MLSREQERKQLAETYNTINFPSSSHMTATGTSIETSADTAQPSQSILSVARLTLAIGITRATRSDLEVFSYQRTRTARKTIAESKCE